MRLRRRFQNLDSKRSFRIPLTSSRSWATATGPAHTMDDEVNVPNANAVLCRHIRMQLRLQPFVTES